MTIVKMCQTFVEDMKSLYYRKDTKAEIYWAKRKFVLTAMASAGVAFFVSWNHGDFRRACATTGDVFLLHLYTTGALLVGHDLTKVAFNQRSITIIQHTEISEEEENIQRLEEVVRAIDLARQCFSHVMENSFFEIVTNFLQNRTPNFVNELIAFINGDTEARKWEGTFYSAYIDPYAKAHEQNAFLLFGEIRKWVQDDNPDKKFVAQGLFFYTAGYLQLFPTLDWISQSQTLYQLSSSLTLGCGITLFCFDCALIKGHDLTKAPSMMRYQGTLLPLPYSMIL